MEALIEQTIEKLAFLSNSPYFFGDTNNGSEELTDDSDESFPPQKGVASLTTLDADAALPVTLALEEEEEVEAPSSFDDTYAPPPTLPSLDCLWLFS